MLRANFSALKRAVKTRALEVDLEATITLPSLMMIVDFAMIISPFYF